MRDTITRTLGRLQKSFASFTAGQKVVAIIGTIALALGGFMVFRWAAAPTYTPLFSNLAPADASAIVDQLNTSGVPYQLSGGGGTIMVPSDQVYDTRIALSGEGVLPTASDEGGYHLLDGQSISTSQFQEQTSFKRAMEGELSKTIEAIDGVDTAVVHLAIPEKEVFADEQAPTTASILVDTGATTLDQGQVQAVVNLVSASIDGLEPDRVTVADSTGRVLTVPTGGAAGAAQAQTQQVADFETQRTSQVQAVLDRVFGANNATAQVTAELNFDKQVTDSLRYFNRADTPISSSTEEETLAGAGTTAGGAAGVVGPEGNVEPTAAAGTGSDSTYTNKKGTSDMALDQERKHVEAAPGQVEALHVSVMVDTQALAGADLTTLQNNIAAGLGLDPKRGDSVDVASMAFSRTAEDAAAQELKAAKAADKKAQTMSLARNGGLVLLLVLMVLVAWLQSRRRAKARAEATSYVVEQLRREALERQNAQAALESVQAPLLALEGGQTGASDQIRDEIAALVERQPEDVAALLRGWLVEKA